MDKVASAQALTNLWRHGGSLLVLQSIPKKILKVIPTTAYLMSLTTCFSPNNYKQTKQNFLKWYAFSNITKMAPFCPKLLVNF